MSRIPRTRCALPFCIVFLSGMGLAGAASQGAGGAPPRDSAKAPRSGASAKISLHDILAYADEHAPALLDAGAQVSLGEAELDAASVWLPGNPRLGVSVGPRLKGRGEHGVQAQVRLSQPIEIAGQRALRIEAAEARARLYELTYQQRRWVVHRQVHEAFHLALVGARERALAAGRVLAFATKMNEITRRQLEAGEVSSIEVRLASGELAQARQALVAAQGVALLNRIALAELSGWPTANPPEVAGQLDQPRRPPDLGALGARMDEHSPGLWVRSQAVNVAHANAAVADREAWPTPSVGLAYGQERDPGEADGAHIAQLTLGLLLPVWNRNQGERARAHARSKVAQARHEAAQRQAGAALARAHAAVDVAATRIAAFGDEVIPAFESNLSLLERAYELGEIDLLQVMVARGRFLDVELDALSAYDDYFASVARLEALLGAEIWADEHHGDHDLEENTP